MRRQESGDDFSIGEAIDANIIQKSSYSGSIGFGKGAAGQSLTDPWHADCPFPENGEDEERDELAVGSEFSYTFPEYSLERSEMLGFGHLVAFFGLKQPQDRVKWPNRQPVKNNRENCLSRTVGAGTIDTMKDRGILVTDSSLTYRWRLDRAVKKKNYFSTILSVISSGAPWKYLSSSR